MFCLFLFLAGCAGTSPGAQGRAGEQTSASYTFRYLDRSEKVRYLIYLPDSYRERDAWPVLMFLHGSGERGDRLEKVKKQGPPGRIQIGRSYPFIVVSPQCPQGQTWRPYRLMALLDHVKKRYRADSDRVYLTGLSLGGYATWEVAASHPESFAALVPISGGGSRVWSRALDETPVWAFHGAEDRAVSPEESRRMVRALRRQGNERVRLTVYEDTGHNAWERAYRDEDLYEWLLKQRLE